MLGLGNLGLHFSNLAFNLSYISLLPFGLLLDFTFVRYIGKDK